VTCVTERRWRLPEMLVGLIIVNNFLNRIERIFFDSRPCLVGYTATGPELHDFNTISYDDGNINCLSLRPPPNFLSSPFDRQPLVPGESWHGTVSMGKNDF